jgi:hypothetical protein
MALDPQTGTVKPGETVVESFRMDGVVVHRTSDQPPTIAARAPHHREKSRQKQRG